MPVTNPQFGEYPILDPDVTIVQGNDLVRDYEIADTDIDLDGAEFDCKFTNDFSGAGIFEGNVSVLDLPSRTIRLHVPAAATEVEPATEIKRAAHITDNKVQPQLRMQFEYLQFDVSIKPISGTYSGKKIPVVYGYARFYPSAKV